MEPSSIDIQLSPLPNSKAYNSGLTITGAGTKEYESLLYKIATSFGCSDCEALDLIQQVCTCSAICSADWCNDTSLKIRLSKGIVHKCIFKLSSQWCSQYVEAKTVCVTDMPLSFHVVYILHDIIGFDENEVAELLNTNLHLVRQRLNKAFLFIKNHQ